VRFQGDASLPRGATSGTSYISAQGGSFNSNPAGLLLTGSATEAVYDLPSNYRFLLVASATSATAGSVRFGADGGKARVQDSSMLLNMSGSTMLMQAAHLLVRPGSELTLGASGLPFNLIPTFGSSANATTPTPYATTTDVAATRTLDKTGAGTLVLDNVKYTDLALSGTTNSQFRWRISEGAVRGRAINNDTPASSSNSLQGFFITMAGGVYEIDSSGSPSTLTATLGTSLVSGSTILNMNNASGGGFSAFNGDATVTLNGGALLTWNAPGGNSGFLNNNQPLIFGSETATDVVTFTNNVFFNGGTREIRVLDNTASTTDYAVMSGVLSGAASNFNKTGPGILRLSAANTYTGATTISAGVLEATTIANSGTANFSSLGAPAAASGTIVLGSATTSATLRYIGSGAASTNRPFNLAGNGGIEANGGGALTISGSVNGAGSQVFTLSGTNTGNNSIGAISGAGVSVVKNGSGRWVLSGSSTFGGPLAINDGTFEVGSTGRIAAGSGVTINGGEFKYNADAALSSPITFTQGTISGTGAIGSAVTVGANAIISPGNSPGNSPGIQPYTNGLTFAENGTYQWEINALAGTVGTNWDAVNVTGPLSLSGLTPSSKFNLDLITLTGSNTRGPLASPYDGGSYVFPIALYSSTSSLTVPVGFSNAAGSDLTSLFNIMLTNWLDPKPNPADISVKVNDTGTGLNLIVVPEPATIALAGIAAACAGVMAWRRRRPTT
jgi:autotransporter-associated beta strand protein